MEKRVSLGRTWQYCAFFMSTFFLILFFTVPLRAATSQEAESIINNVCSTCHKFKGEGESRFNLKGPDLMWGGSKYQRQWLIDWLTGKEAMLYAKSYRWDQGQEPEVHTTVTPEQAEAIADYFEKHFIDPRVKIGALDLSTVTKQEVEFGKQAYIEHSCIGCHTIEENGQLVGGPPKHQSGQFRKAIQCGLVISFWNQSTRLYAA